MITSDCPPGHVSEMSYLADSVHAAFESLLETSVRGGDGGQAARDVFAALEELLRFYLLKPKAHGVYVAVHHRVFRYVFSARLYPDGSGSALNGRMSIIGWDRSAEHRTWQAELIDTFPADSDWLLDIPQKVVRPEIVTAVLSHIAARTIRPVRMGDGEQP